MSHSASTTNQACALEGNGGLSKKPNDDDTKVVMQSLLSVLQGIVAGQASIKGDADQPNQWEIVSGNKRIILCHEDKLPRDVKTDLPEDPEAMKSSAPSSPTANLPVADDASPRVNKFESDSPAREIELNESFSSADTSDCLIEEVPCISPVAQLESVVCVTNVPSADDVLHVSFDAKDNPAPYEQCPRDVEVIDTVREIENNFSRVGQRENHSNKFRKHRSVENRIPKREKTIPKKRLSCASASLTAPVPPSTASNGNPSSDTDDVVIIHQYSPKPNFNRKMKVTHSPPFSGRKFPASKTPKLSYSPAFPGNENYMFPPYKFHDLEND